MDTQQQDENVPFGIATNGVGYTDKMPVLAFNTVACAIEHL
ncbi:hypothetical protein [Massilia soli]|nr:hypothetical protein [Massilia soli]